MQLVLKSNRKKIWLLQHLELLFWVAAIFLLFFMNTNATEPSLCIFRFIGFNSCPGCGLGHSIHHALHLNFVRSFDEHKLGIPALLIIMFRIEQLFFKKKPTTYEI